MAYPTPNASPRGRSLRDPDGPGVLQGPWGPLFGSLASLSLFAAACGGPRVGPATLHDGGEDAGLGSTTGGGSGGSTGGTTSGGGSTTGSATGGSSTTGGSTTGGSGTTGGSSSGGSTTGGVPDGGPLPPCNGGGTTGGGSGACGAFSSNTVYVDATRCIGSDGPCCGRLAVAGPGGPCETVGQAVANLGGDGWTIQVKGDSNGNASANEIYPLRLGKGVTIVNEGKVCFPGSAGNTVFSIDQDNSTVKLLGGASGFVIGVDCEGHVPGATDGVLVGQAANDPSPTTVQPTAILSGLQILGVQIGIDVEAAQASAGGVSIQGVGTGVFCESPGLNTNAQASFGTLPSQSVSVVDAANEDVSASTNCTLTGTYQLGAPATAPTPCPSPKLDTDGFVVQENATVNATGTIDCMSENGISLGHNQLFTSNPSVTFHDGRISHCGEAGLFSSAGTLTLEGVRVDHNHYGAEVQQGGKLVLSGSGSTANTFSCNTKAEPGAACQGTYCPPGADLWNASGVALTATGDLWDDPAVAQCYCKSPDSTGTPQGCVCTGGAQLTDGLAVLDMPAYSDLTTTTGAGQATGSCP